MAEGVTLCVWCKKADASERRNWIYAFGRAFPLCPECRMLGNLLGGLAGQLRRELASKHGIQIGVVNEVQNDTVPTQ